MSREKLIVLLYERMIEHFEVAESTARSDRAEMSRRLNLAQRIVTELNGALDHSIGGAIAANLASIYDFVFREILEMQLDQNPAHAVNCRETLQPLLDAWSKVPPGSADREAAGRGRSGTESASAGQQPAPGPRSNAPDRLISVSA
jgi:flagellar protein FliS